MYRPECYCLSRHVLAAPTGLTRGMSPGMSQKSTVIIAKNTVLCTGPTKLENLKTQLFKVPVFTFHVHL